MNDSSFAELLSQVQAAEMRRIGPLALKEF